MPTRMDWIAGLRRLRRKPLYTLSVVLAFSIGIAAVTIVFSWFDGLFLRPLPGVHDSRSLQVFKLHRADYETTAFSGPDYEDLAQGLSSSMDVAAYSMSRVALSGDGRPEQHWALFVSGNFFETLGLQPAAGRLIQPSDTVAKPVVVVSYDWWRSRFHGDPAIVGKTIYLNRRPVQVAGVAPRDFQGPYTGLSFGLYLPLSVRDTVEGGSPRLAFRQSKTLTLLARLKAEVPPTQASESARVAARWLDQAHPRSTFEDAELVLTPLWRSPAGAQAVMGPVMLALGGVVWMVLLLACINACGVMLIESSLRRKEMAIRLSVGAGSGGLLRVCLAEATLLAALGAAAGVLVAHFAVGHLQDLIPALPFPAKLTFRIGAPVLAAALAAAIVAALFCGIWSGLEARRQSATLRLRRERSRMRSVLSAAQIAASFLLLSASAAFYRSVEKSRSVDLGFDAQSVILDRVDLTGGSYTPALARGLLQNALARAREIPSVEAASLARAMPFGLGDQERLTVAPAGDTPSQAVVVNRISPGYFATLGIPILSGRDFSDLDGATSVRVAIVNEALAIRLWPAGSPMQRDLLVDGRRAQVVAVVRSTKQWSLTDESQPCLYLPIWQSDARFATLHMKSRAGAGAIHRAVERELERLDPALPLSPGLTMAQQVETAIFPQRVALVVLGIFAIAGMYLAAIGLFGVIAHMAQSRAGEIALRMALGATAADICRMMTKHAGALVLSGLGAGIALSLIVSPVLRSVLVGQSGIDLASAAATAGVILLAAAIATALPTRRAMRVQPAAALRGD